MPEDDHTADELSSEAQAEPSKPGQQSLSSAKTPPNSSSNSESDASAKAPDAVSSKPLPSAPAKPIAAPKPAIPPAPSPSPPFHAAPSMPLSMTIRPESAATGPPEDGNNPDDEFDHLIDDFKSASEPTARSRSFAVRLLRGFLRGNQESGGEEDRHVAFDGYRGEQYDTKLERDRRYGTVYKLTESANAYLVRLELPRLLPNTSLKQVWHLGEAAPVYDYSAELKHNVLAIQARLRGEALRRLAYISPSYPSGFLTRIELPEPVISIKHRMRGQMIEVMVFKLSGSAVATNRIQSSGASPAK